MPQQIKYSVIVPVYNSEKTIARCLNSLTVQNRDDVQIIVVNDGSTDSSDAIIRDFSNRYPQILYISQENAGVSQARNAGLDEAQGIYITFVDSDDYVREDYFHVLDQHGSCDLLVFCHEIIGNDPRSMPDLFAELEALQSFEQRLQRLLSSRRIMSPWDKRFQKAIIEKYHIRFPNQMHIGEDFNFCMSYIVHCGEMAVEPEQIIYNDITGQNSLSRKYRSELDVQLRDAYTMVADTIRNSAQPNEMKRELLGYTDYLFIKLTFSSISEEFKQKNLHYIRDYKRIADICSNFRQPLSDRRVNWIHRALRLALACKLYYPFYLVSYWVKGRKYRH